MNPELKHGGGATAAGAGAAARLRRVTATAIGLALAAALGACGGDTAGESGQASREPAAAAAGVDEAPLEAGAGWERSAKCARCHVDIHHFWSVSTHATSFSNRNFQVALHNYERRVAGDGPLPSASAAVCLSCHAPLLVYADGAAAPTPLAEEGVACDFCHSVTDVKLDSPARPYVVDRGLTKRGPVKDATGDKHPVAYQPLFEEARLCAGCHEYKTAAGLAIISTYSEWKAAAKSLGDKTCQKCHMPVDSGSVVDPQIQRTSVPVNTHQMPGSHSRAQLRSALVLRIDKLAQKGNDVVAEVVVENVGAGHAVPTGMPSRKLVLSVEAATPTGKRFQDQRVFQKVLVDAKGLSVESDSAAFLDAVAIGADTRIKVGELRRETFTFAVPHDEQVTLRAQLDYSYSPQPDNLPEERLSIVSVEKTLAAR